jgi:hypothetical protein
MVRDGFSEKKNPFFCSLKFQNLKEAYLTHSFHCCAFKFPKRHDPTSHEKHLKLVEKMKNECKVKDVSVNGDKLSYTLNKNIHYFSRRKRSFDSNFEGKYGEIDDTESNDEEEKDPFAGYFHPKPVDPEESIEAMCGNLTVDKYV